MPRPTSESHSIDVKPYIRPNSHSGTKTHRTNISPLSTKLATPSDSNSDAGREEEEEFKPKLEDFDSDEEGYSPKKAKNVKSKAPGGATTKASPKKNGGGCKPRSPVKAWTGQEDWEMYSRIHPRVQTAWAQVSQATGRDVKVGVVLFNRSSGGYADRKSLVVLHQ